MTLLYRYTDLSRVASFHKCATISNDLLKVVNFHLIQEERNRLGLSIKLATHRIYGEIHQMMKRFSLIYRGYTIVVLIKEFQLDNTEENIITFYP